MSYLFIKWIHILSATILFGTGLGSAFYFFMAQRTRDLKVQSFATKHVVKADWWFTTPAVIIQLFSGLYLVIKGGFSFTNGWVLWALILYVFAAICWLPVVWLQIQMHQMIKQAVKNNEDLPEAFWKMNYLWILLGSLAFPAVILIFYLMVIKPVA